jgi:hypothetical protein
MNESRNEYLLELTGLNAMHQLYEKEDLPLLMEKIDGKYYALLKKLLSRFVELETDMSKQTIQKMNDLQSLTDAISRETDSAQFIQENAHAFKNTPPVLFEQSGSDQVI